MTQVVIAAAGVAKEYFWPVSTVSGSTCAFVCSLPQSWALALLLLLDVGSIRFQQRLPLAVALQTLQSSCRQQTRREKERCLLQTPSVWRVWKRETEKTWKQKQTNMVQQLARWGRRASTMSWGEREKEKRAVCFCKKTGLCSASTKELGIIRAIVTNKFRYHPVSTHQHGE